MAPSDGLDPRLRGDDDCREMLNQRQAVQRIAVLAPTNDHPDSIGAVCVGAVGTLSAHPACHSFLRH